MDVFQPMQQFFSQTYERGEFAIQQDSNTWPLTQKASTKTTDLLVLILLFRGVGGGGVEVVWWFYVKRKNFYVLKADKMIDILWQEWHH